MDPGGGRSFLNLSSIKGSWAPCRQRGSGAGAGCAHPLPTLHSVTAPQNQKMLGIRYSLRQVLMFAAPHQLTGRASLGMNTSGGEQDLPSYLFHLLSVDLPFCPVLATPASSPILGQTSCAPASGLLHLPVLFARQPRARFSNGLQTSWTCPPCTPCPSHSFSVVFNTISLRLSSLTFSLIFFILYLTPHPC